MRQTVLFLFLFISTLAQPTDKEGRGQSILIEAKHHRQTRQDKTRQDETKQDDTRTVPIHPQG
jgi:hypothetical protein